MSPAFFLRFAVSNWQDDDHVTASALAWFFAAPAGIPVDRLFPGPHHLQMITISCAALSSKKAPCKGSPVRRAR
jgi:hypothetical protein